MEYLKIQNEGLLNPELIGLMGASTKVDNPTKIGQFGTGLKYAIAYFLREGIDFKLFVGDKEVKFGIDELKVGDNDFKIITINGKPTNITLNYGQGWHSWEAIREVYCNALDEGGTKGVVKLPKHPSKKGHTTFYIECKDNVKLVVDNWSEHFIGNEKALYEDEDYAIYNNTSKDKMLRLYKNGILIHTSPYYKSAFRYDFKKANLNELREYKGFMQADMASALLSSNNIVGSILVSTFKKRYESNREEDNVLETVLDYNYARWEVTSNLEKIKEIFIGYFFLTADSHYKAVSSKAAKVNESLLKIVSDAGLPVEKLRYSTGYYGSGGYTKSDLTYKVVPNDKLEGKVKQILKKYGTTFMTIETAAPLNEHFDFLLEGSTFVISSDLDVLSPNDLEVVVLLMISNYNGNSLHKVLKRFIKLNLDNKQLTRILFDK